MKLILIVIALAGCGGPQTKQSSMGRGYQTGATPPDWVNGNSSQHSRDQYMTGVGSADDRTSAEDRARGEIARVFSSAVTVQTNISESEQMKGANGQYASDSAQQTISQDVNTISKQILDGVEIAEGWQDPATHRVYALAVLDRQKGLSIAQDKLADLDKQAGEWQDQLSGAQDKLSRVKYAMKLLATLQSRDSVNAQVRVLDPGGKGASGSINEAAVRSQAVKALSALDVLVRVSGESAGEVQTGIIKGLNAYGLKAKDMDAGGPGDILVYGKVDSTSVLGDGSAWKWGRSTATVSLKEGATGKIFLQFDASERASAASDQAEAIRRSRVKLAAAVSAKVDGAISNYFENQ